MVWSRGSLNINFNSSEQRLHGPLARREEVHTWHNCKASVNRCVLRYWEYAFYVKRRKLRVSRKNAFNYAFHVKWRKLRAMRETCYHPNLWVWVTAKN